MVSIILPTYNEAENVEPFIVELGRVMRSSAFEWEVI
ncbi:MAG: polyprenol monophosphomannose synthase, partial [Deltaproteobacteria bacterium]